MFTSDITTTAFLQAKTFAEGSEHVIWIRLLKDAKMLHFWEWSPMHLA